MGPRPARPQPRHPRQDNRRGASPTNGRVQNVTGAGAVVFRRRNGAFEIFFVKNAYGYWTFPKGKQEKAESLVNTAIREAGEEAGLKNMKLIAPLGRTQFRFRQNGALVQKSVHFYLFEVPADTKETMSGVEGGMWEATWVKAQEAFATSGYRNLDRLLSKALRIIAHERRKERERGGFQDRRPYNEGQPFSSRKPRIVT
ncbi:MAG: NUDIX domain-containing protein [Candidatus Uhrbacteria bacterium]